MRSRRTGRRPKEKSTDGLPVAVEEPPTDEVDLRVQRLAHVS
jgi:hypothetical protein